jgi:hypothetical protein
MKNTIVTALTAAAVCATVQPAAFAHGGSKHVKHHVNPGSEQCSFQLDPSLTRQVWRQFTDEWALSVEYKVAKVNALSFKLGVAF